jgi:hypothetical protein
VGSGPSPQARERAPASAEAASREKTRFGIELPYAGAALRRTPDAGG